jgi:hypothetical protein
MTERVSSEVVKEHLNVCGDYFCYECRVGRDLLDAREERDEARAVVRLQQWQSGAWPPWVYPIVDAARAAEEKP